MAVFSEKEKQTLKMIVDALAPSLTPETGDHEGLFCTGADDFRIADLLEDTLERAAGQKTLDDLKQFLRLLERPAANWVAARHWGAFSTLDLAARTDVLRAWGNSRLGIARKAFQGVKRLTLFLFYAYVPPDKPNPVWAGFAFGGPMGKQMEAPKTIQPLPIIQDSTLETDILIIGSGAGGGVMAAELTHAGYQVLVLEKGGYYDTSDFTGEELTGNTRMFDSAGTLTTADISMSVLAGSALGGGTTINWSASFRTPEDVLHEWEHEYGFSGIHSAEYQASMDAVWKRSNVNSDESPATPQNAALEKGSHELGYHVEVIPRNVKGCEDCGACGYGCLFGAKQSTVRTFLQDAYDKGAKIVVRAYVEKITQHNGRANGALAWVQSADGQRYRVNIKAKAVVVSAGSVHTPALLLRSGLSNPNIGKYLRLHPVTVAIGEYEQPVKSWIGAPMTRVVKEFANLDGKGYGYRIETPAVQPGILGASFPWQSGRQHRQLMQRLHHYANFLVLTRDYYGGSVTTNAKGNPVIHYELHPYDAKHLLHGLLEGLKIHRAAGAQAVYSAHNHLLKHQVNGASGFQTFLDTVAQQGLKPNAFALFSAHQMGSCRIAGTPELGAVKPTGETYEVKNLFVADASVFPTASGVNPMMTIMATTHFLAQRIKALL